MSISTECGRDRPFTHRNWSALSSVAESEPDSVRMGNSFSSSSPKTSLRREPYRARIQLRLPRRVLISPLWATYRYGCASGQLGKVFVLKREWTIADALSKSGSERSL